MNHRPILMAAALIASLSIVGTAFGQTTFTNEFTNTNTGGTTTIGDVTGGTATGGNATGGNATATGGAGGTVTSSGNSTSTGGNVTVAPGAIAPTGGAVNGSGNASNDNANNASQNVNVNNTHEAQKRNPVSTAYAPPLTSGIDTCMGSSSVGGQGVGFGVSLGTTWNDENCVAIKQSRELAAMGFIPAAIERLCMSDEKTRQAMMIAGTPCPSDELAAKQSSLTGATVTPTAGTVKQSARRGRPDWCDYVDLTSNAEADRCR